VEPFIHPSAIVETRDIGNGTRIWAFAHILPKARIGADCNICDHTFIENDVHVGDRVTVKCGVYLWDGITLEDDVFVGPSVVFTNDLRPRSKMHKSATRTIIRKFASLGAGTTVLAGVTVGEYSMTGVASVVTRDVPSHALVYGNPARFQRWIDKLGRDLIQEDANVWRSMNGERYVAAETGLELIR